MPRIGGKTACHMARQLRPGHVLGSEKELDRGETKYPRPQGLKEDPCVGQEMTLLF